MRTMLLVLVVCSCTKSTDSSTPPATDAAVPGDALVRNAILPPRWTPATEIERRYSDNFVQADLKFKDKPVRIIAFAANLTGTSEDVQIRAAPHNLNSPVPSLVAHMSKTLSAQERAMLGELKPAYLVALKCLGAGKKSVPEFTECIPEWVQPDDLEGWARSYLVCIPFMRDGGTSAVAIEAQLRMQEHAQTQLPCNANALEVIRACEDKELHDSDECKSPVFLEPAVELESLTRALRRQ